MHHFGKNGLIACRRLAGPFAAGAAGAVSKLPGYAMLSPMMLDTVEEGKGWGSYCKKRLAWLRDALAKSQDRKVYLFMHHPPFDVGMPCVDRLGLGSDGQHMGEVLADYNNIRHLFFGHVHRPIAGSWRGIPYTTLRGTNHQVPLDFNAVEVVPKSHEPPAYALVLWFGDIGPGEKEQWPSRPV